jgi:hypothetical protein
MRQQTLLFIPILNPAPSSDRLTNGSRQRVCRNGTIEGISAKLVVDRGGTRVAAPIAAIGLVD